MLINLTPHVLRFFPVDCPDRIDPSDVKPLLTVDPSGSVVRIEETTLGTWFQDSFDPTHPVTVHIEGVEYGHISGLPYCDVAAFNASGKGRTYYVVPLVVALAAPGRPDLLVPYREVRNLEGTVIGCRQLARPC